MSRGVDWGRFFLLFSIVFLGLVFYGIQTCKKQAERGREDVRKIGEKAVAEIEQAGKRIEDAAEKIPKRLIGDLRLNFGDICTRAKRHLCDESEKEFCAPEDQVGVDAFLGSRENKICCEKECSQSLPLVTSRYPLVYVGGESLLTCAFQKGSDCGIKTYCQDEQWIIAKDTKTCCRTVCVERVQQKDIFFPGLGYTTIERFRTDRFGVWYGSGIGEGFYTLGRPNYAETRRRNETKYMFSVDGRWYAFLLIQNEPSKIDVKITPAS